MIKEFKFRDDQIVVKDEALKWLRSNHHKCFIQALMGFGKGVVSLGIVEELKSGEDNFKTVVVCSQKEHVRNYFGQFLKYVKGKSDQEIRDEKERFKNSSLIEYGDYTFATHHSLADKKFDCKALVSDEGHLFLKESKGRRKSNYRKILKNLNPKYQLGLDATPDGINKEFCDLAAEYVISVMDEEKAAKEGWYIPPNYHFINTSPDVKLENEEGIIHNLDILKQTSELDSKGVLLETPKNKEKFEDSRIEGALSIAQHQIKIVIYAFNIKQLKKICSAAALKGIRYTYTTSKEWDSSFENSTHVLEDFKTNDIPVLIVVAQGVEAYDFPKLRCLIHVNYPYNSTRNTQTGGRIVRTFPGKTDCDIYYMVDCLTNPDVIETLQKDEFLKNRTEDLNNQESSDHTNNTDQLQRAALTGDPPTEDIDDIIIDDVEEGSSTPESSSLTSAINNGKSIEYVFGVEEIKVVNSKINQEKGEPKMSNIVGDRFNKDLQEYLGLKMEDVSQYGGSQSKKTISVININESPYIKYNEKGQPEKEYRKGEKFSQETASLYNKMAVIRSQKKSSSAPIQPAAAVPNVQNTATTNLTPDQQVALIKRFVGKGIPFEEAYAAVGL